ncbi:MAG: DNA mismatch repair protein MutS [Oscillospiraceae bacterium]|nr:DNA mismatch repair protein MutS [Oscillospiraceae bacterium]MBR5261897.1 DNA mismatch repair protein MutS [Oscillospiraceae bacterium]
MAEITPMKKQYNEIKAQYDDCLLFFRLGDFYEMFDDDAKVASRELELQLTTRDRGKPVEEQTPMCGVPYHSAEAYIGRLIAKGYKVAICEQTEDPALAKGIVKRDVIRVITPGTVTETSMLDEGRSNYLASVFLDDEGGAVCFADVSTGEFCVRAFRTDTVSHIVNELGRFSPREAVLSSGAADQREVTDFLTKRLSAMIERGEERFDYMTGAMRVCDQFNALSVDDLGFAGENAAVCAAGAMLSYLTETQKFDLGHINTVEVFSEDKYMELDYTTLRNLELTENLRSGEKRGSLLWVLDKTGTPMGGRMLRSWVERPLVNPAAIKRRLTAVNELFGDTVRRSELIYTLRDIGDMRRLVGKAVYGTANAKDLKALGDYCALLPTIRRLLEGTNSNLLAGCAAMDCLEDIAQLTAEAICDEPPFSVREGGMMRPGYNEEVDYLREIKTNGSGMVRSLEARERERTGIKKLKIGYNKVFGYYIDVPRSAGDAPMPEEYIRKQTLVSNERYITPELKELENTLLSADDRLSQLEYKLFTDVRLRIAAEVERVQRTADTVAELDCICSLADVAVKNGYTMPEVDLSRELNIVEGRHPVVEFVQKDTLFVPNDTHLNDSTDRVAIVTGPNMAGKSTYMRQTALIVLMAQIGSFVPAKSASIGIVDRVFTRIGASDDLASGQSTFMVEMSEMANILKYATGKSLLILDEIGRGTSTYDGMAIARAVLEHCADKRRLGAKTMFATHYHELSALEGSLPGVRNYNITAKKHGGTLVFLRKIVPGAADDSYGIEVAKLAGVPDSVIVKAKTYLRELENGGAELSVSEARGNDQISLMDLSSDEIRRKLLAVQLDSMTPIEAMTLLYELKKKAEE